MYDFGLIFFSNTTDNILKKRGKALHINPNHFPKLNITDAFVYSMPKNTIFHLHLRCKSCIIPTNVEIFVFNIISAIHKIDDEGNNL